MAKAATVLVDSKLKYHNLTFPVVINLKSRLLHFNTHLKTHFTNTGPGIMAAEKLSTKTKK